MGNSLFWVVMSVEGMAVSNDWKPVFLLCSPDLGAREAAAGGARGQAGTERVSP